MHHDRLHGRKVSAAPPLAAQRQAPPVAAAGGEIAGRSLPVPPAFNHFGKGTILPVGTVPATIQRQGHVLIQPTEPKWREGLGLSLQRTPNLGQEISARLGKGNPLPSHIHQKVEKGLGTSLPAVTVHTDGEADRLTRQVNAVAFTTGSDIFFRQGSFNPDTPQGLHLVAHEAAHVVQQQHGPVDGTPRADGVSISDPSDRFERAAGSAAARVSKL